MLRVSAMVAAATESTVNAQYRFGHAAYRAMSMSGLVSGLVAVSLPDLLPSSLTNRCHTPHAPHTPSALLNSAQPHLPCAASKRSTALSST